MNIAKACIKHKVATLLAVIMVVIFGVLFGTRLQMALMPNMEMPMAVVMTTYVGANPSDIEELVTSPLESAIMSVSGVDEITSTSAENVSTIQITYLEGTDLDIAATKLREQFDMATARAVAAMPVLTEYCLPFVKQGGVFAAMKGPSETAEQAETAAKLLGGEIVGEESYTLPTAGERKLIRIRKTAPTPQKYPRRSDKIKKQPLE